MKTNQPGFRIGCLILAAMVTSVAPSYAQTQEPAGASASASVISNVAVTQMSQRASVRVEGAGSRRSARRGCRTRSGWCLISPVRGWRCRRP